MELNKEELKERVLVAKDLFRKGEITRVECFRIEVDAVIGENTGDIKYEKNTDFIDNTM